mmetsp:Transcript_23238/g.62282  ORF Transcript_23238/g.62282 Transcript_23238/m.62282 type:complete len:494 (+) Transcript_23238:495-1976(+)
MVTERSDQLAAALASDLGKTTEEATITEMSVVLHEIDEALANLKEWMKPVQRPSPGVAMPCYSEVRQEPRGVVLVISPFNYPVSLALGPMVSAITGGNVCVIKPSELCPSVSSCIKRIVGEYFPGGGTISVVEGGIPENTALMAQPWDLVFFTGSGRVGKIIARAAADTLTPVVLELGGKSPVVVDKDLPDLTTMANRIAWGKTINAGQTCVAPDYMVCHKDQVENVSKAIVSRLDFMFGKDPSQSDFSRIVSTQHAQRLYDMIVEAEKGGAQVLCGGSAKCDPTNKYIAPTVIAKAPKGSRVLTEEIFGPILVIREVDDMSQAIQTVNDMEGTPLAIYIFTSNKAVCDKVLDRCPSGGAIRNDVLLHFAANLPFGGLGTSGYGNAHSDWSWRTFTHERAFMFKPCHPAFEFGDIRYAPYAKYGGNSGKAFIALIKLLPNIPVLNTRLIWTSIGMVGVGYGMAAFGPAGVRTGLADLIDSASGVLRSVAAGLR